MITNSKPIKFILICFILWSAFLSLRCALSAVVNTAGNTASLAVFILSLAVLAAAVAISFGIASISPLKFKPWMFAMTVFCLSLALRLVFCAAVKTPQYSDFLLFHYVTSQIARGEPLYINDVYFQIWSYQAGFPAIMSPIMKLGGSIKELITVNCVFIAAADMLVYPIARRLFAERTARLTAILHMIFPTTLALTTVYTNQHLSRLLAYAALYILMRKDKLSVFSAVSAGIILALAYTVRPDTAVFVAAAVVYALLMLSGMPARKKDEAHVVHRSTCLSYLKNAFKRRVLPLLICIAVFFIGFALINQAAISTGIQPYGLGNNYPLYKFAVGLNESSGGQFSPSDAAALFENPDYRADHALRDRETLVLIKERLSIPVLRLIKLFDTKAANTWTNINVKYPAFTHFTAANQTVLSVTATSLFRYFEYWFRILIFACCTFSGIIAIRKKEIRTAYLLPVLIFMGFSFISLFIEVQYRYQLVVLPAVFMAAVYFADHISLRHRNSDKS